MAKIILRCLDVSKSRNNVFDGSSYRVHLRPCRAVIKDSRGYNPPSSNYFSTRAKAERSATTDACDRYTTESLSSVHMNAALNIARRDSAERKACYIDYAKMFKSLVTVIQIFKCRPHDRNTLVVGRGFSDSSRQCTRK